MFLLSKLKNNTLVLWHIVFALLQTLSSFSTYAENVLTKGRHSNALKGITNARQSKKKKVEDHGKGHIFLDCTPCLFLILTVTLDFSGPIFPIVK